MKYLYQRNNGIITKYKEIQDKVYMDIETGITVNKDEVLLLGKVSENIIDLIEVGDIVMIKDKFSEDVFYMYNERFIKALKEDIKDGSKLKYILTKEEIENRRFEV